MVQTGKSEGYWLPRTAEVYYSFIGEIPWCGTIPNDEKRELEFVTAIEKRMETTQEVSERLRWEAMLVGLHRSYGLKSPETGTNERKANRESRKPRVKEAPTIEKISVMLPTLRMAWESYHTVTTPHQGDVVAKNIAQALGLWVGLPSMDMFDPEGRRAAITTDCGDHWRNGQSFVFLRKDLFDKFLTMKGVAAVWGLWGQRDYPAKLYQLHAAGQRQDLRRVEFKDVYSPKL